MAAAAFTGVEGDGALARTRNNSRDAMRRSRTIKQQRDRRREMQLCVAMLTVLVCMVVSAMMWKSLTQPQSSSPQSLAQIAAQLKEEMRTGPILFVPLTGNVCSRRLIDNETWRIRDGGQVVCDAAVSWNATVPASTYSVSRRVDALRAVFSR